MAIQVTTETIKKALIEQEFKLYYQPKVSMVTGKLCGAEALIRWQTPEGEIIPPDQFIPVAEQSDLICKITQYVFRQLIIDYSLIGAINENIKVSFNASGKDFHNDHLTTLIVNAINSKLIEPHQFEIEVTETVLIDEEHAKTQLNTLSNLGIAIAMDDFGTGHSGLVELTKWPFSILKIDRSFVVSINKSNKEREILQAAIRMAHQLNMDVVAEGIEDEATYRVLQEYGCKTAQGFWISKPLPLTQFVYFIRDYNDLSAMPIGLIYMAQLDHIQWKKNIIDTALFLHNSNENRSLENVRGCPQLDHKKCKLGQWYYNEGVNFKHIPVYAQLEKVHRELHQIGADLLQLAQNKCSMETLSTAIQQLTEKSMSVLYDLQLLENYLHIDQYKLDDK